MLLPTMLMAMALPHHFSAAPFPPTNVFADVDHPPGAFTQQFVQNATNSAQNTKKNNVAKRKTTSSDTTLSRIGRSDDDTHAVTDAECRNRQTHIDTTKPLMERALCPWFWTSNFNPNRRPVRMHEARCKCVMASFEHGHFTCEEVTMEIEVAMHDPQTNITRPIYQSIAVACVATPQVQHEVGRIDGVLEHTSLGNQHEDWLIFK